MKFTDKISLDEIRFTSAGFLVSTPKVSRVGIMEYDARELGFDEEKILKVYRDESEVFSKESIASYAYKPITNGHPPIFVDSKNWKDYSIGQIGGEILRDGEFVRVPICLMDDAAIEVMKSGRKELSMGYEAELCFEEGEYNGEHYDAVQKNLRMNHLALCDQARGGPELKIGDKKVEKKMSDVKLKTMKIGGISVQVSDTAEEVIQKEMDEKDEEIKAKDDETADLKKIVENLTAEVVAMKAKMLEMEKCFSEEKAKLEGEVSPEKMDEALEEREKTIGDAKKIFPELQTKGVKTNDIKRQAVVHKLGDQAKSWTDEQVKAGFTVLSSNVKTEDKKVNVNFGQNSANFSDSEKEYDDMKNKLSNAWRGAK